MPLNTTTVDTSLPPALLPNKTQIDDSFILKHLYTGVIWVNNDLTICWINPQTEQVLAASQSRLIGLNILDILNPVQSDMAFTSRTATTNTSSSSTQYTDPLHKKLLYAQNYQQPFIEFGRHIVGVSQPLLVSYSVTPVEHSDTSYFLIELWEEKAHHINHQENQIQEQHDVARQMLRSVAHEVKNPLAGIRGAAQLLIKLTNRYKTRLEDTKIAEYLGDNSDLVLVDEHRLTTYADIVISETDRLTKLIEQLIGSNQLPEWQTVNIHEPLEHVLILTQTRHPKVKIMRDYDLSLPELTADKNQLIQVFLNLVNNACDAMLEQDTSKQLPTYIPKLEITTRIEYQYTIGTTYHRQVLKVCIKDNGPGVDNNLIGRLFFPLVTGRANGTGLGLALVQEMVHRHHGAIKVDSEFGKTVFCVYLPFYQPQEN